MNRSKKIRSIYRELRASVGDRFTSKDLLEIANTLITADGKLKTDKFTQLRAARRTFEELDLDEAFADGGWRVMRREKTIVNALHDDVPPRTECLKFAQSLQMELIW